MTTDNLHDYPGDGEHTHAQPVPFIVWALLVCVIVLALSLGGLAVYLTGRASLADSRNAVTEGQTLALRRAVCTVLNPIRPGQVRGVDQARALPFPAPSGMQPLCSTLPPPKPAPSRTHPATRSTSAPAPPRPAPANAASTPAPAPVKTTPSSRPSSRPTPTHSPAPQPTPTRTCLLGLICH